MHMIMYLLLNISILSLLIHDKTTYILKRPYSFESSSLLNVYDNNFKEQAQCSYVLTVFKFHFPKGNSFKIFSF